MTPQQHRCLVAVQEHIAANGSAPSFEQIAVGLGLSPKSKSRIGVMLDALEERGHIRRLRGRRRAIEICQGVGVLTAREIAWCHMHAERVRELIRAEARS